MAWYDPAWGKRASINVEGNGDQTANYALMLDVYFNCPAVEADSTTQFLYRPATRYRGTYDRVYVVTCMAMSPYTISIKYLSEEDGTQSTPVSLGVAAGTETHNGGSVIVLQHQTGALATHNGTILVAMCDKAVDIVSRRTDQSVDDTAWASLTWGAENQVDVPTGADVVGIAYPCLIETDDGVIWCFYHELNGDDRGVYYRTLALGADPDDDAWSARTKLSGHATNNAPWYSKPTKYEDDIHIGLFSRAVGYKDIYYIKKTHTSAVSQCTSTSAGNLVDTTADFVTMGVAAGWRVYNVTDNTHTYVDAVTDLNTLDVHDDIMADDEYYILYCFDTAAGGLKLLPLDSSDADHTADIVHVSLNSPEHWSVLWDCSVDSSGNPYIAYGDGTAATVGTAYSIFWAYYSAGWQVEDTGFDSTSIYVNWLAGCGIDESDPYKMWISVSDGTYGQIQAYERVAGTWYLADGNNGTTAVCGDGKITQASPGDNFRPSHVRDADKTGWPAAQYFEWMWFYQDGTYNPALASMRFAYPGFNNQHFIGMWKNCQFDFEDVIFTLSTDAAGTSAIGYYESDATGSYGQPWFQDRTNSWRGVAWVGKWTCPVDDSTVTMYCYYDHVDGDRVNDNDQVVMDAQFIFCDHFDSGAVPDANRWDVDSGTPSVAGSYLELISAATPESVHQDAVNYPFTTFSEVRARMKGSDTTPGLYAGMYLEGAVHGQEANRFFHTATANQWDFQTLDAGVQEIDVIPGLDTANWHVWKIMWFSGDLSKGYSDYLSETSRLVSPQRGTTHATQVSETEQGVFLTSGSTASAGTLYVDWVFRRPLTTEPTITVMNYENVPIPCGGSNIAKLLAAGVI